jgi:alpha-galactosidase
MTAPNIVVIGAGSAVFGPNTIASLMRCRRLRGSTLSLVDLNAAVLEPVQRVAQRLNQACDAGFNVEAGCDRRQFLDGADFVVVSIEVQPREKLWRMDWEIPLRHGLRQPYGENGGPGGMMHAFRQIPPFMDIVRDMEAQCPKAWLINFSNPLPRLTRAITKYSTIATVGKCHQIEVGYAIAGTLLRHEYNLDVPQDVTMHSDLDNVETVQRIARQARQHVAIKAAGLNHFTWVVDVRERKTGRDLYPLLRDSLSEAPPGFEPLSMDLFRAFGYCPVPGDTHLAEYLPWTHDPLTKPWERYGLKLYDWQSNETSRERSHRRLQQMADGTLAVDGLRDVHSEGAAEIIEAISANLNRYEEAVNVPNRGAIPNLPAETIVELPAIAGGDGVRGIQLEPLPAPIAELCRREAALAEMVVDAAVAGDRDLALQALLLDPMVNDTGRARRILDDYLEAFSDHLPQFA